MNTFAIAYPLAAAVLWGLVYTIDVKILRQLSPTGFLLIHAVIILIIVSPILYFQRETLQDVIKAVRPNLLLMILSSILIIASSFLSLNGIKALGAPLESILEITYPFFVALFVMIFYGTSISMTSILGAILICAGSAVVIWGGK